MKFDYFILISDQCCGRVPFWALFFQWLSVTRASDPPVPCGDRLIVALFNILDIDTKRVRLAALAKMKPPNVCLSMRYRVTRASMTVCMV